MPSSPPVEPAGVGGPVDGETGVDQTVGKIYVTDLATPDRTAVAIAVLPGWWLIAPDPAAYPYQTLDERGRPVTRLVSWLRGVDAPEPDSADGAVVDPDIQRVAVDDAVDRPGDGPVAPRPRGAGHQQHDDDEDPRGHPGSLAEDEA